MSSWGVITWRRFCSLIPVVVFGGKGLRVIVREQKTCSFLFKHLDVIRGDIVRCDLAEIISFFCAFCFYMQSQDFLVLAD